MPKKKQVRKSVLQSIKAALTYGRKQLTLLKRNKLIEKQLFTPKDKRSEDEILIQRMTNWQRSQWGKAGYPKDLKAIKHYAALKRRST